MKDSFLLVIAPHADYWQQILRACLNPLGTLEVYQAKVLFPYILNHTFALIIIDATHIINVPDLIRRIRQQCTSAKIVVVTVSPTWKEARKVFEAGAMDYIRKIADKKELLTTLKSVLEKTAKA